MVPENDEQARILSIYCELGVIDRHFNTAQSNCRALASTWLLAAFAGMGVVLSKDWIAPLSKEVLVAAVGLASAVGLSLLWMLDLLVYQRMLDSAFLEAKKLENQWPWLPRVRNNMRILLKGRSLPLISLFYIVTVEAMILISGIAFALWLHRARQPKCLYWVELILYAAIFLLSPILMYRRTSATPEFEKEVDASMPSPPASPATPPPA